MNEDQQNSLNRLDSTTNEEFVFGSLFMIANRLQTLLDREFEPFGMTARQWFLSVVIGGLFDKPPTLGEAAAAMGSTHQNVKQVALKLQEKGFLEMLPDAHDGRALRLKLTQKSDAFWMGLQERSENFLAEVYQGLEQDQMAALRSSLAIIAANIENMSQLKTGGEQP